MSDEINAVVERGRSDTGRRSSIRRPKYALTPFQMRRLVRSL